MKKVIRSLAIKIGWLRAGILLVWGLGLTAIVGGRFLDYRLGFDPSDISEMTPGDYLTLVGFAGFILASWIYTDIPNRK